MEYVVILNEDGIPIAWAGEETVLSPGETITWDVESLEFSDY